MEKEIKALQTIKEKLEHEKSVLTKKFGYNENDATQAHVDQIEKDWEDEKAEIVAERDKLKELCANLQQQCREKQK